MYSIKTLLGLGMLQDKTFVDIKENERLFQESLAENNNEVMWGCVFVACYNICKSILSKRGFLADDDYLYDLTIDSTMMVMRNILERGVKPEKLSSYCYMRCFAYVQGYKQDKFSRKLKDAISNNRDVSYYLNEEIYDE